MDKIELIKQVKKDLRADKIMSLVSLLVFIYYFFNFVFTRTLGNIFIASIINLLIWLNAMMITKRNVQILEVC